MRVSPDEGKLRKQLEETRKMLESWDGWSPHEAAGRCLRWLWESEEAAEHFRIAASKRHVGKAPQGSGLLAAGNLFRLAGDRDRAIACLERARAALEPQIPEEHFAFVTYSPSKKVALALLARARRTCHHQDQ